MASEVYVMQEGSLRWVQASGTGTDPYTAWRTASAPQSGLFAYVQPGWTFTSGQTLVTVKERGTPTHHKRAGRNEITVSMTLLWTGAFPAPSAYNASVPMMNLEFKQDLGVGSAIQSANFIQFHGVATDSFQFTEQEQGNQMAFTFRALGMNGPTASGYLSTQS